MFLRFYLSFCAAACFSFFSVNVGHADDSNVSLSQAEPEICSRSVDYVETHPVRTEHPIWEIPAISDEGKELGRDYLEGLRKRAGALIATTRCPVGCSPWIEKSTPPELVSIKTITNTAGKCGQIHNLRAPLGATVGGSGIGVAMCGLGLVDSIKGVVEAEARSVCGEECEPSIISIEGPGSLQDVRGTSAFGVVTSIETEIVVEVKCGEKSSAEVTWEHWWQKMVTIECRRDDIEANKAFWARIQAILH